MHDPLSLAGQALRSHAAANRLPKTPATTSPALFHRHHPLSHSYPFTHPSSNRLKMKNSLLIAATALLGTSSAAVHKAKLQKVPLSEQLVSYSRFRRSAATSFCKRFSLTVVCRSTQTSTSMSRLSARSTWAFVPRSTLTRCSVTPPFAQTRVAATLSQSATT